jgi:hypothetical protein
MDMKSQKTILLLTGVISIFVIAFCLGTGINAAVNGSKDQNVERAKAEMEQEQSNEALESVPYIMPDIVAPACRPILREDLMEIQNPSFSPHWGLEFQTYFGEECVKLWLTYKPSSDSLEARFYGKGVDITYDFPDSQPFLDFIQFVSDNQNVLLDQSEYQFECVPDDWVAFSYDGERKESFELYFESMWMDEETGMNYYCVIKKWLIPGQENPPELIEAARLIRSLFLEEVLAQENDLGFTMADDTFLDRIITE